MTAEAHATSATTTCPISFSIVSVVTKLVACVAGMIEPEYCSFSLGVSEHWKDGVLGPVLTLVADSW
jgi:hypothetical protein